MLVFYCVAEEYRHLRVNITKRLQQKYLLQQYGEIRTGKKFETLEPLVSDFQYCYHGR